MTGKGIKGDVGKAKNAKAFVATCGKLRYGPREMDADMDAASLKGKA